MQDLQQKKAALQSMRYKLSQSMYGQVIRNNFDIFKLLMSKINIIFSQQQSFTSDVSKINDRLNRIQGDLLNIHIQFRTSHQLFDQKIKFLHQRSSSSIKNKKNRRVTARQSPISLKSSFGQMKDENGKFCVFKEAATQQLKEKCNSQQKMQNNKSALSSSSQIQDRINEQNKTIKNNQQPEHIEKYTAIIQNLSYKIMSLEERIEKLQIFFKKQQQQLKNDLRADIKGIESNFMKRSEIQTIEAKLQKLRQKDQQTCQNKANQKWDLYKHQLQNVNLTQQKIYNLLQTKMSSQDIKSYLEQCFQGLKQQRSTHIETPQYNRISLDIQKYDDIYLRKSENCSQHGFRSKNKSKKPHSGIKSPTFEQWKRNAANYLAKVDNYKTNKNKYREL